MKVKELKNLDRLEMFDIAPGQDHWRIHLGFVTCAEMQAMSDKRDLYGGTE